MRVENGQLQFIHGKTSSDVSVSYPGPAIAFSARRLERETRGELNLTTSAYGGEYSADVLGEIACCILENGVSVPSQGERALRVARHSKIRMIEQVVSFRSDGDLRAFRQLKALLQRQVALCERGATQDVTPGIAKLAGGRQRECGRIKPARRRADPAAVWTNTSVRTAGKVGPLGCKE